MKVPLIYRKEPDIPILYHESWGSTFLRSLGIFLPDYTASLKTNRHIHCLESLRPSYLVLTPLESAWCKSAHKNYSNAVSHTHTTCNFSKLEYHPLSVVRDCIFNIFATLTYFTTLHIWRPSPPSATWGRAMPWWQGTHLTRYWWESQKERDHQEDQDVGGVDNIKIDLREIG
jgi:hypothetical protein